MEFSCSYVVDVEIIRGQILQRIGTSGFPLHPLATFFDGRSISSSRQRNVKCGAPRCSVELSVGARQRCLSGESQSMLSGNAIGLVFRNPH